MRIKISRVSRMSRVGITVRVRVGNAVIWIAVLTFRYKFRVVREGVNV